MFIYDFTHTFVMHHYKSVPYTTFDTSEVLLNFPFVLKVVNKNFAFYKVYTFSR
jgi:hypothetical protein